MHFPDFLCGPPCFNSSEECPQPHSTHHNTQAPYSGALEEQYGHRPHLEEGVCSRLGVAFTVIEETIWVQMEHGHKGSFGREHGRQLLTKDGPKEEIPI